MTAERPFRALDAMLGHSDPQHRVNLAQDIKAGYEQLDLTDYYPIKPFNHNHLTVEGKEERLLWLELTKPMRNRCIGLFIKDIQRFLAWDNPQSHEELVTISNELQYQGKSVPLIKIPQKPWDMVSTLMHYTIAVYGRAIDTWGNFVHDSQAMSLEEINRKEAYNFIQAALKIEKEAAKTDDQAESIGLTPEDSLKQGIGTASSAIYKSLEVLPQLLKRPIIAEDIDQIDITSFLQHCMQGDEKTITKFLNSLSKTNQKNKHKERPFHPGYFELIPIETNSPNQRIKYRLHINHQALSQLKDLDGKPLFPIPFSFVTTNCPAAYTDVPQMLMQRGKELFKQFYIPMQQQAA